MYLASYRNRYAEFKPCPKWHDIYGFTCYRKFKTKQERAAFFRDEFLKNEYGFKVRYARSAWHLNAWNYDKQSSRSGMKSWKALNKCRKQYMKRKYKDELFSTIERV